jgi:hypothetical protein
MVEGEWSRRTKSKRVTQISMDEDRINTGSNSEQTLSPASARQAASQFATTSGIDPILVNPRLDRPNAFPAELQYNDAGG